jgi:prolyl oligopeptidase family protein
MQSYCTTKWSGYAMQLRPMPLLFLVATVFGASLLGRAQAKRPVTSQDCVSVRDLKPDNVTWHSALKISPDGKRIAYLLQSPNLATNQNEIELYVRRLPSDPSDSGKPILVGDLSSLEWLADGRHLTVLMSQKGQHAALEQVDAVTGNHELLFRVDRDISEYSMDQAANTLVYAVDASSPPSTTTISPREMASGYRIPYQVPEEYVWPRERLFVTWRTRGAWTSPKEITIRSPLSGDPLDGLTHAGNSSLQPTLSPDGRLLLLTYWDFSENMPDEWRASAYMKFRNSAGVIQAFKMLVLYDLATGETTVPLKTPWVHSAPSWLPDSATFVVVAAAPVGSDLEREDMRNRHLGHSAAARAFWVELHSRHFEQIASHLAYPWEGLLGWDQSGALLLRTSSLSTIERFVPKGGKWQQGAPIQIPLQVGNEVATDGDYVIGDFSDTTTPPELFVYQPGKEKGVRVFATLNPDFQNLTLGRPEEVHWRTSTGFRATGLLLLPPGYVKDHRYPLVIQTKPFGRFFVCGFGDFPSFAPQPLANAGILYLGLVPPMDSKQSEPEERYFPSGYPGYRGAGGIAEAAFQMDLWDSAVESLSAEGLVDRNAVGIVGFSRTGWYTEFILAHSSVTYRAATVADNVEYSLGEYWLSHDADTIKQYDQMYGGPPYGDTLANWLKYSVSFNLDKIHTPLLMEEMGDGVHYDNPSLLPISLAQSFEVFAGLNRLHNPVELYYYPNDGHEPEHPQARLATLERNVDWYRFWLQGYERANPEDPNQYSRWHGLKRMLQLRDTGPSRSGAADVSSDN